MLNVQAIPKFDYILNFVVFDDDGSRLIKKAAAYHQYWAVNEALACTLSACGIDGDPEKLISQGTAECCRWRACLYNNSKIYAGRTRR